MPGIGPASLYLDVGQMSPQEQEYLIILILWGHLNGPHKNTPSFFPPKTAAFI